MKNNPFFIHHETFIQHHGVISVTVNLYSSKDTHSNNFTQQRRNIRD